MNEAEKVVFEDVSRAWAVLQDVYLAVDSESLSSDEWGPVSAGACKIFRKAARIFFRSRDANVWTDAKPPLHALVLRLLQAREAMHEHLIHDGSIDAVLETRADIAERIARLKAGDWSLVWNERTGHA